MRRDPREILGISADATLAQAKAAYRRLAELFHPDRLQGLRPEVQAEGARRLRQASDAMRDISVEFGRPLTARRQPAEARDGSGGDAGGRDADGHAGVPVRTGDSDPGEATWQPSDEATHTEARIYDVELRGVDGPAFHVRWTGRHAAATLAALRHAHRVNGAIRQVEWGSYEGVFDGAAVRRLVSSVLHDDVWRHELAEVVRLRSDADARLLPARRAGASDAFVDLGTVLSLLEDGRWYSVLADVY